MARFIRFFAPVLPLLLFIQPARAELTLQQYLNYRGTPQGEERLDVYLNGMRDALAMFEDYEKAAGALSGSKGARVQSLYCIPDTMNLNPEFLRSLLDRDLERYQKRVPPKLAVGDSILNGLTELFPCTAGARASHAENGQAIGGGASTGGDNAPKPSAAAKPDVQPPSLSGEPPAATANTAPLAAEQAITRPAGNEADRAAAALDAALAPKPVAKPPAETGQARGQPAPNQQAGNQQSANQQGSARQPAETPVPEGMQPMMPSLPVMPPGGMAYPNPYMGGYPPGYYPQQPSYPPGYGAPTYPPQYQQPQPYPSPYAQPYPTQGYPGGGQAEQPLPNRPSLILPPGGKPPVTLQAGHKPSADDCRKQPDLDGCE